MRFRKKPVEINAIQFNGTRNNVLEIIEGLDAIRTTWYYDEDKQTLAIVTLEGNMVADKGDWIIKGVKGEFYPCKPDIFELTYEKVVDNKIKNEYFNGENIPLVANFQPPLDFTIDEEGLYCPGCGKYYVFIIQQDVSNDKPILDGRE